MTGSDGCTTRITSINLVGKGVEQLDLDKIGGGSRTLATLVLRSGHPPYLARLYSRSSAMLYSTSGIDL